MADEHWTKTNLVFGSAGMAASGMLPQTAARPKVKEEPVIEEPVEEILDEESVSEDGLAVQGDLGADDSGDTVESVSEAVTEETTVGAATEVEAVPVRGYGINSKAQGLFTDLKVGIASEGPREILGANWDLVFENIPGLLVDGLADPSPESLEVLKAVHGCESGYSDYREMLARGKPNLVALAQMNTDRRYEVVKNCLMSGCHVICPAPFTRTLAEAEALIALADRRGLKISVVNPLRLDPNVERFHREADQLIGDLVEIRLHGAMDETSGGEDLLVRGGAMFDLVRMFAGNVVWCASSIQTEGRRSTHEDIFDDPSKPWGPLVGDAVFAQLLTEKNVNVVFQSDARLAEVTTGWGMEFIGTRGTMRLFGGSQPELSLLQNPGERSPSMEEKWQAWPENLSLHQVTVDELEGADASLRLVVADWLEGITKDRQAEASPMRATKSLEIVHGILQSGVTGKKVYFPLPNRHHPLTREIRARDIAA